MTDPVLNLAPSEPPKRPNALTELYQHVTALARRIIALEQRPIARDGRDGVPGRDGKDGVSVKGDKGDRGEKGEKGDRGEPGADGASVSAEDIAPLVAAEVARAIQALPKPTDGRDGRDGAPGRDGVNGRDYDESAFRSLTETVSRLQASIRGMQDAAAMNSDMSDEEFATKVADLLGS